LGFIRRLWRVLSLAIPSPPLRGIRRNTRIQRRQTRITHEYTFPMRISYHAAPDRSARKKRHDVDECA
jgi:hypothetical protein